jgi:hypothetical protein
MLTNENFIELNNNFYTECKAKARIFTLLTVPTGLFLLIIFGYLEYFPLKVEMHSVILIGFIYFIYLFFVRHNAYFASCKFKSQYKELVQALKTYINNNLLTIGDTTKANGNVDDFLREFTINIRNTNFSSVASGIFPTLGILGTFISIAFSMPDFSSGTTTALEKEITILLGGVGTAFYVSIYGIFLSLWWIFFEKIGMSRFEHDSLIIKEHTKSFFWTKLDIESIHLKSNIENFEKMTNIFEQFTSVNLLENINLSLEKRVELVENIVKKENELSNELNENLANFQKLFETVKLMTVSITSNLKNFEDEKIAYLESSKILKNNIGELNTTLSNLNPSNIEKLYENILKSVNTMKNETDRIGWRFNQELDEYDTKFSEKLSNSLKEIDNQTVKIIEDLNEFKELSK